MIHEYLKRVKRIKYLNETFSAKMPSNVLLMGNYSDKIYLNSNSIIQFSVQNIEYNIYYVLLLYIMVIYILYNLSAMDEEQASLTIVFRVQ